MTAIRPVALALVAVFALPAVACGGDDNGGSTPGAVATTGATHAAATQPTATVAGPEALAKVIYDDFVAMNKELAAMLTGDPAAAQLRPKVTDLKNRYVEKFVAAGRVRAKMNSADAATVESEVRRMLFASPAIDTTALSAAVQRFNSSDVELAQQITSLNILTQYAFFELLKKQEPAEAARLGIE